MDALSGVAGGIAVVQLIHSIHAIITFAQRIKNAPVELRRLTETLEHLEALLEDVRQLIERQASLQQACGPSNQSLLLCLNSCEKSIGPLRSVVERGHHVQSQRNPIGAKLRRDIRLGFKAKDILELERVISCEIKHLSAALIVNNAKIQLSLMHHHRSGAPKSFAHGAPELSTSTTTGEWQNKSFDPSTETMGRHTCNVLLKPAWLGLSRQKTTWHPQRRHYGGRWMTIEEAPDAIAEASVYYWASHMFGFGLRWSQHRHAGRIAPSLSVYPVVENFDVSAYKAIKQGSAEGFQQLMCSGEIHPFTHNSKGESLLHIAAQEYRLDICRIVSAHGLKPDYTHSGRTPFHYSLNTRNQPPEGPVDMYRFLIHTLEQIDDFTSEFWVYYISPILQTQAGTEWFLRFTKNELPTEDMCKIQLLFLKKLVGFFAHDYGVPESYWGELSVVAALLDDRVVDQIASGKSGLLKQLFSCDMPSSYSQGVGAVYIGLLHSLRIDVEHCVREEMSKLQGGIIRAAFGQVANKQIVFERTVTQGWVLRWEYIPDHIDTPGYLLTKEFTALTFNVLPRHVWTWPFCEVYWKFPYENRAREDTKWTLRFSRRIAAKARKERVRLGQKRPRSRMPGSWVA